jgi:hypothetical protein
LAPPGLFDNCSSPRWSALAIDVLVFLEINGRTTEYGTAIKVGVG